MEILIPGKPVPKLRPRLGKYSVYDPQKEIKDWYRAFLMAAMNKRFNAEDKEEASPAYFLSRSRAFRIEMVFGFKPPTSWSQKRRKEALWQFCTFKPDLDNLVKFVLDCGNGILYPDDKAIAYISAEKIYTEIDQTYICIEGTNDGGAKWLTERKRSPKLCGNTNKENCEAENQDQEKDLK